MYRYQINSKRKHFYSCQLCSFVFIKSEAVRNHYKNRHPDQTCFTEEYNSDSFESDLDDLNSDFQSRSFKNFSFFNHLSDTKNKNFDIPEKTSTTLPKSIESNNKLPGSKPIKSHTHFNNKIRRPKNFTRRHIQNGLKTSKVSKKNLKKSKEKQMNSFPGSAFNTSAAIPGAFTDQYSYNLPPNNTKIKTKVKKDPPKKDFPCDVCGKKFVNVYNRRRHYQVVHGIKLNKADQSMPMQQQSSLQLASSTFPQSQSQMPQIHQIMTPVTQLPIGGNQYALSPAPISFVTVTGSQFSTSDLTKTSLLTSPMIITPSANSMNNQTIAVNPNTLMQNNSKKSVDHSGKKIVCEKCNKTFASTYNKRRHSEMVHGDSSRSMPQFKCSSCDKTFTSIFNKTRHESIHRPIMERLKHSCMHCNKRFTTSFILKTHIQKNHPISH
ncbi:hypothetical protein QR98_0077810 [Sarcoptes scabiei]|uniref:C2H2-type domain-containing protein n=1 Tax=Sarcoptes scabiei TaxID=52283 RepID=A0A132AE34_SARSC|nr:hypothetical protein QR98_0077810 [Sarcoptes scabiei]